MLVHACAPDPTPPQPRDISRPEGRLHAVLDRVQRAHTHTQRAQTNAHIDANADMLFGRSMRRVLAFRTTAREIMSPARPSDSQQAGRPRAAQWHSTHSTRHAHTRTQPMSICSLIRHLMRLCCVQTLPVQARVPHRLPLPSAYMSIDGWAGRQVEQACSRPPTSTQVRTRACTHAPTHGTPSDSSQPALICGYDRLPRQRKTNEQTAPTAASCHTPVHQITFQQTDPSSSAQANGSTCGSRARRRVASHQQPTR